MPTQTKPRNKARATSGARRNASPRRPDAIAVLKHDHREVEELFKRFESAGDGAAKQHAPTRPHPRSADTPPGNVVAAPIAAALDHAREVGRDVAERVGIREGR